MSASGTSEDEYLRHVIRSLFSGVAFFFPYCSTMKKTLVDVVMHLPERVQQRTEEPF